MPKRKLPRLRFKRVPRLDSDVAIEARVNFIAGRLQIPDWEVDAALAGFDHDDMKPLVDFAQRHGQCIDWIMNGNMKCIVARLAESAPWP